MISNVFYRVDNLIDLSLKKDTDMSALQSFLYVGQLPDEKGVELFCEAFKKIKSNLYTKAIVVGEGNIKENLENLYPEFNFWGWRNRKDVQEIMLNARDFVFPSKWYEGAPSTIIEALSYGFPCIVSNCTSAIEEIEEGVNGIIFWSGRIDCFIEKFMLALDDNVISKLQHNIVDICNKEKYTSV